jgi:polyferredoxin
MKIFKLLNALIALLLVVIAALPTVATNGDFADFPLVELILSNFTTVTSLTIIAWVVNGFLASLASQGTLSLSTLTTALQEVTNGEAFTRAEERFGGDANIHQLADSLSSFKMLVPKDSELYRLLNQIQVTLTDLYDGVEETEPAI